MQQRFPPCILVTCVVPWDESFRLKEEAFRGQVEALRRQGFHNLYIFGTAGEGHAVDTARFRDVTQLFYEATRGGDVYPQVGVIALSTPNVIERLGIAYEAGFRIFQISLPAWGALNDTELMTFFKDLCGNFPDSQFLHYNVARAKRVVTPTEYRRLADAVPNLVATKVTAKQVTDITGLMRVVPELQHFFTEMAFPLACTYGPCSLLSAYGPMCPSKTHGYFELGRSRQLDKLFALAQRYQEMTEAVLAPTGGRDLTDGAYDKIVARLAGHDVPMRLLSPYEAFSEEVCGQCARVFRERFPDWAG
jgi:dihydrodipicolinate synthase/N-acetylneuraminate lyase